MKHAVNKMDKVAFDFLPSQREAVEEIDRHFGYDRIVSLVGQQGTGKSAIAQYIARRDGATYLSLEDYLPLAKYYPYDRFQERVVDLIIDSINKSEFLILDDFTFCKVTDHLDAGIFYRFILAMPRIREEIARQNKKLLVVGRCVGPDAEGMSSEDQISVIRWEYDTNSTPLMILARQGWTVADYAALLEGEGGDLGKIDCELLHFQAPKLTLRQLQTALRLAGPSADTDALVDQLERRILHSNLRLDEVEQLTFDALPGTKHIQDALETHVILPFENPVLAKERGIAARRGVMLFGPPGTGKTSIGRALAHRMKGRFFLIDGTIGTEPPHEFMRKVKAIIDQAIKSAPSVLFIDDADMLFTIPHVSGVIRYLLTILDGMESVDTSRMCVMMTVMDPRKIPDALVRSGRVELWLETSLPDAQLRAAMIGRWLGKGLPDGEPADLEYLANLCEGFTAADLRRVVEDAKLLHGRNAATGQGLLTATAYLAKAIGDIIATRTRMNLVLNDPEEMAA
jgi:transitional endoplasmic reticulum ATPase